MNSYVCHVVLLQARPMWPYLTASFGTGAFALLGYLVRWDPPKHPVGLPPTLLVSTIIC